MRCADALGWQPIETAPRDGTDILCFCCAGSDEEGEWGAEYFIGLFVNGNLGKWEESETLFVHMCADFWMPLLEAPRCPTGVTA